MTLRRKIILGLLIFPAAAAFLALLFPGAWAELLFLIVGVPIIVLNVWEFFLGENGSSFFDLSQKRPAQPEGSIMKSKPIAVLLILSAVFVLLVIGYTVARAAVDEVPYSLALYTFLIKLGTKLWHFLSLPVIFIALLLFALALLLVPQIVTLLQKRRKEAAAAFPEVFTRPLQPFAQVVSESEDNESILAMERMIGEGIDLKSIQLMLEVDGIDVSKTRLLDKIAALSLHSEALPVDANPAQREAFYRGVLEGLYGYLFPLFCSIETKNEERTARFSLKPGLRERLVERLNESHKPTETMTV